MSRLTDTDKAPTKAPKDTPGLLNLWRSIYLALPIINFPGTSLNIAFTLAGAGFLAVVRVVSLWVFASVLGYDFASAKEISGGVGSIAHSIILCPGLAFAFMTYKSSPAEHRSKAPQWWVDCVDAMLQFCTAYMVYDAIFICLIRMEPGSFIPILQPGDSLFLAHHFVTVVYMTQNRVYEAGHASAMVCMFLGELSNPFQNSYFISGIAMELGKGNESLHFIFETAFAIVYFSIRVFIAPIFFLQVSYGLLFSKAAKDNLPLGARIFWVCLIWGVEVGSYSWIVKCYDDIKTNVGFDLWTLSASEL